MNIFASVLNIYSKEMKAQLQRQVAIRNIVSENKVTSQEHVAYLKYLEEIGHDDTVKHCRFKKIGSDRL